MKDANKQRNIEKEVGESRYLVSKYTSATVNQNNMVLP